MIVLTFHFKTIEDNPATIKLFENHGLIIKVTKDLEKSKANTKKELKELEESLINAGIISMRIPFDNE